MAEVKTRVSVTSVTHQGGSVTGTLADSMVVTPLSFDASIAKTGTCVSAVGTLSATPTAVALTGISNLYLLQVVNKSATVTITVTLTDTADSWEMPVPPNGVALIASKTGGRTVGGVATPVTLAGAGAAYELVAAGAA